MKSFTVEVSFTQCVITRQAEGGGPSLAATAAGVPTLASWPDRPTTLPERTRLVLVSIHQAVKALLFIYLIIQYSYVMYFQLQVLWHDDERFWIFSGFYTKYRSEQTDRKAVRE